MATLRCHGFDGIDLTLSRGSILAVIGKSGCGKSTLGRCLAGLEKIDSGEIRVKGADSRAVQYTFQDAFCDEPPAHGCGHHRRALPHPEKGEQARTSGGRASLDELGGVAAPGLAGRFPCELSGGQKERAIIARALAAEARVLIFERGSRA